VTDRRTVGAALVVIGALVGFGILVGVVWSLIAPTVVLEVVENGLRDVAFQSGRFFIAESVFGILAAAAGLLAALVARRWIREMGWPVVVALAIGGLLASIVAWRVGVWLGPDGPDGTMLVIGDQAELPLRLRSSGLLLVWSITSLAVALVATTLDDRINHSEIGEVGQEQLPRPEPADSIEAATR
jgi:hypothetical protein